MLHATEVLGAEVYDAAGNYVGRVRELFIVPDEAANRVARLLLGRGRYRPLVARYDQIATIAPGRIRLTVDELRLEAYAPHEEWLAVRKDLLDQQIIDTSGRKVVRVNDLDLTEQPVNGTVELRVTQVDVGLTGAVRRLLQGVAPPSMIRRVQEKLPPRVIPWEFVNLIESDPLRRVKLRITHDKLRRLHPADLADIMEELSPAERQSIIASLDEETAAEALAELDARLKSQVVEKLGPERAAEIVGEMDPDEAADLLADLPPETTRELLREMPREEAEEVRELLEFPENTAGAMMNPEFVEARPDDTRESVMHWVRRHDVEAESLDTIYVRDAEGKFAGAVALGRLLLAAPDEPLEKLLSEPKLSVAPDASAGEVFELFDKYDLRGLAVVDDAGRAIGAITVDDVVHHLRERL
jgi:magnesium transporter